jgi:hypothetical protein
LAHSAASANDLVEYGFEASTLTCGLQSTCMCPPVFAILGGIGRIPCDEAGKRKGVRCRRGDTASHEAIELYFDSFDSLPLIDLPTMKLSPGLNEFQRFLAQRIYSTTSCCSTCLQETTLRFASWCSSLPPM